MIEIETTIKKAQIREAHALVGRAIAPGCELNGQAYESGQLIFVGFAGGIKLSDGLYHGHYRFDVASPDEPPTQTVRLADLPYADIGGAEDVV